jgi:hypothetical protein
VKRHEAWQEAKRLNQEHPERGEFRWVPVPQADGSWIVSKMARIARDEQPATRTISPREPRPRKAGSRPAAAKPPAKPPARGLRGIAKRREVRIAFLTLALALAGFILWELRVLLRPLFMTLLVRHPALVSIPLIAGGSALLVHLGVKLARRRPPAHPQPARGGGRPPAAHDGGAWRRGRLRVRRAVGGPLWGPGPVRTLLVCGALGFLFAGAMTSVWTGAAIYDHTDYGTLSLDRLKGGQVRIKPYEVARGQTKNSLNSPTEHPTNLHIVKVNGRLMWTSVRDPDGFFRVLTKPTKGVISVDAVSTGPGVKQSGPSHDADFRYGPGMRISESIRWQVYKKKCFTCDVAEMTVLPTAEGPIVIAPYIRYKGGWFVRRPVWGGVYVIHADGRIEDLSPAQAAAQPVLRDSGRIYPEKLARRTADAYKFKRGVWSRLFLHTDQLDVADTEKNRQPYLQDFAGLGPQWVTTLKPHGGTFTTAGVMTTDAVTGKSRIWLAGRGQSLIGNQRALDIVRGESFPGIDFAEPDSATSRGKFQVVEPRQIFPGGRLQFLLSIIPDSANRVTMSVVVDAASQRVVAKFPATPEGDSDLIAYLRNAELPAGDGDEDPVEKGTEGSLLPATENRAGSDADPGRGPDLGQEGAKPGRELDGPAATLRRLLQENRAEQRSATERISGLEAQERDLRRLLKATEKPAGSRP